MTQNNLDPSHFEAHITVRTSGETALVLLAEHTPLSKQKLKSTMTRGAVWLESSIGVHRLRRAKKILKKNDVVHIYYDEAIQNSRPQQATLIADEGEYSVWNKPYGMYSQGSKWSDHCTVYRWAETHLQPQRPAFPVHRLDRAASGLIILAHTKTMAKVFSDMFKNRQIQKQYKAAITGKLENITLPYTLSADIDGKPALSRIISAKQLKDKTLLTIEIDSGRKHQIRKHLATLGHPIIGDRLYGLENSSAQPTENLQLQASYLQFVCPLTNMKKEYRLTDSEHP